MKRIFLLSKENLELSKAEVLALAGNKEFNIYSNLLVADANFDFSRLAYTRAVYDLLFVVPTHLLHEHIARYNWQKAYESPFCIRVFGADKNLEPQLAALVWDRVKSPRVDLENPRTSINFFFHKGLVVAGILSQNIDQLSFEKRRPHLRPEMHPSSLHPRLARAMVNLTGARKGTIIDPFCGTGGILIEAGLIGLNIVGYDIDSSMIGIASKNLNFFKLKYTLKNADATRLKGMLNYVVSDLPYGKSTRSQDLRKLYSDFFKVLKDNLRKKAVLGLPSFINSRELIRKAGLKIEKEFTYYIHRSLSKKIFVISS